MINPPKSKQYYLSLESEKRKEAEKYGKDYQMEYRRFQDLKSDESRAEQSLRNIETSQRSFEREASSLLSNASSLENKARTLSLSPDPRDRAEAVRLNNEARALRSEANNASSKASSERAKASSLKGDLNLLRMKMSSQERLAKDMEFRQKRALKEADELHKASLKAV